MSHSHYSVLLKEAVEALICDPSGFYVDGTYGRGGHSRRILDSLNVEGSLLAIDKDPAAIANAEQLKASDTRFDIAHRSFAQLSQLMAQHDRMKQVSGVLLDLGVSSPQLDDANRGFSFQNDGPLDMRMNTSEGVSASEYVNTVEEEDLIWVLKNYGEERFAKRIARAIIAQRLQQPFSTTAELAKVVSEANPAWEKNKHPATRAFQAIRIQVNNELGDIEQALDQALDVLKVGGRLVVISFHSLEDRIVKQFIRKHEKGDFLPKGLPVTEDQLNKRLKSIRKAVKASQEEVQENVRSRSAVMRVAEKLK